MKDKEYNPNKEQNEKVFRENLQFWKDFHKRSRALLKARTQTTDEKASIETLGEDRNSP